MGNIADEVRADLLCPAAIRDEHLWGAVDRMLRPGTVGADVYLQARSYTALDVAGGVVVGSLRASDRGMGLRTMTASGHGFTFGQNLSPDALTKGADAACAILAGSEPAPARPDRPLHHIEAGQSGGSDRTTAKRAALLAEIEDRARALDPRISSSKTSLVVDRQHVLLVNDAGLFYTDTRCFCRLTIEIGVQVGNHIHIGYASRGLLADDAAFLDQNITDAVAERALSNAARRMRAKPMTGGTMPVVLAGGWSGVLFHEAVGHGLEADIAARGISPYSRKLGQSVASPACTIIDDGTLPGRAGSRRYDDEGVITQATVLVRDGVLESYMHDRRTAREAGVASTGNGRRQSYAHLPMPRMTNTYLAAGTSTSEEVIASVDHGIYCVDIGSGQVDLVSGQFVFGSVDEAYRIEGGKITEPVSGVRLMGSGPEIINNIGLVANDLSFDHGIATCSKFDQDLLVAVGQPTIRVDAMTVGGAA